MDNTEGRMTHIYVNRATYSALFFAEITDRVASQTCHMVVPRQNYNIIDKKEYVLFTIYAQKLSEPEAKLAGSNTTCESINSLETASVHSESRSEDEQTTSTNDQFTITVEDVHIGYILNEEMFLNVDHWNALMKRKDGRDYSCFLCGIPVDSDTAEYLNHLRSDLHLANLDRHTPLPQYGLDLFRRIDHNYHCAPCNLVLTKDNLTIHRESDCHRSAMTSARRKAISYGHITSHTSDMLFMTNVDEDSQSDEQSSCEDEPSDNPQFSVSYASMMKSTSIAQQLKKLRLAVNEVCVVIDYLAYNMIISYKNKFYCTACDKYMVAVVKHLHIQSKTHGERLDACTFLVQYGVNMLRYVNDTFYYCMHCNHMLPIVNVNGHLSGAKHVKRTKANTCKLTKDNHPSKDGNDIQNRVQTYIDGEIHTFEKSIAVETPPRTQVQSTKPDSSMHPSERNVDVKNALLPPHTELHAVNTEANKTVHAKMLPTPTQVQDPSLQFSTNPSPELFNPNPSFGPLAPTLSQPIPVSLSTHSIFRPTSPSSQSIPQYFYQSSHSQPQFQSNAPHVPPFQSTPNYQTSPIFQPVLQSPQSIQPFPQPVQQSPQSIQPFPQPVQQSPQSIQPFAQPVQQSPQSIQPFPQPVQQSPQSIPQPVQQSPQSIQPFAQPVQQSPQSIQPFAQPVQQSPQSIQPFPQPVQQSPQSIQPFPQPVQQSPQPVQQSPQSIQPFAQPVQQSPQSIQPFAQPVQQSPQSIQPFPQPVQLSPQSIQPFAQPVQQSPQSIQSFAQPVQQSPQSIQPFPQLVQQSTQSIQPFAQPVQQSPQSIQPFPQPVQQSPQSIQQWWTQNIPINVFGCKIYISTNSFNYILSSVVGMYFCALCNVPFHRTVLAFHLLQASHKENVGRADFVREYAVHLIRKIRHGWAHCAVCNTMVPNVETVLVAHINSEMHKQLLQHALRTNDSVNVDDDSNGPNSTVCSINYNFIITMYSVGRDINDELYIFVRIDNVIRKTPLYGWHTVVDTGGGRYCFVCEVKLANDEAHIHVATEKHLLNLVNNKVLDFYSYNLIRRKKNIHHCGVCNVLILMRPISKHLKWDVHTTIDNSLLFHYDEPSTFTDALVVETQSYSDRDSKDIDITENYNGFKIVVKAVIDKGERGDGNSVNVNDVDDISVNVNDVDIARLNDTCRRLHKSVVVRGIQFKVMWGNWNGIHYMKDQFKCIVCQRNYDQTDQDRHVKSAIHTSNLNRITLHQKYENDLLREIDDRLLNCIVCNVEMPKKGRIQEHIEGNKHKNNFEVLLTETNSDVPVEKEVHIYAAVTSATNKKQKH